MENFDEKLQQIERQFPQPLVVVNPEKEVHSIPNVLPHCTPNASNDVVKVIEPKIIKSSAAEEDYDLEYVKIPPRDYNKVESFLAKLDKIGAKPQSREKEFTQLNQRLAERKSIQVKTFEMEPEAPRTLDWEKLVSFKPKHNSRYIEIPHLLDGFLMLNRSSCEYPEDVYVIDVSSLSLKNVATDDLSLFTKQVPHITHRLHIFKGGDNKLTFKDLGALPELKTLILACNNITTIDTTSALLFPNLTSLDLSFNTISQESFSVLAALPSLTRLDLSQNNIQTIPNDISDMRLWWQMFTSSPSSQQPEAEPVRKRALTATLSEYGKQESRKQRENIERMRAKTIEVTLVQYQVDYTMPGFLKLEFLSLEGNGLGADDGGKDALEILGRLPSLKVLNLNHNFISSLSFVLESTYPNKEMRRAEKEQEREDQELQAQKEENVVDEESESPVDSLDRLDRAAAAESAKLRQEFEEERGISMEAINGSIYDDTQALNSVKRYEGFPRLEELRLAHNKISTLEQLMGIVCLSCLNKVYLEGNPVMVGRNRISSTKDFDIVKELPASYGIDVMDECFSQNPGVLQDCIYKFVPTSNAIGQEMKRISRKNPPRFVGHLLSKTRASNILNHLHKQGTNIFPHQVSELGTSPAENINKSLRRYYQYTDDDIAKMVKMGRVFTLKELDQLLNPEEQESSSDSETEESSSEDDSESLSSTNSRVESEKDQASTHTKDKTFITSVDIVEKPSSTTSSSGNTDANSGTNLPNNIQASVRALRHALSNPVSFERVSEASYSVATFAYKRRLKQVLPRYALPDGLRKQIAGNKRAGPLPPVGVKEKTHGPQLHVMNQEMAELKNRMQILEKNISEVLASPTISKIPKSTLLVNQVKDNFERIQYKYTKEALKNMFEEKNEAETKYLGQVVERFDDQVLQRKMEESEGDTT